MARATVHAAPALARCAVPSALPPRLPGALCPPRRRPRRRDRGRAPPGRTHDVAPPPPARARDRLAVGPSPEDRRGHDRPSHQRPALTAPPSDRARHGARDPPLDPRPRGEMQRSSTYQSPAAPCGLRSADRAIDVGGMVGGVGVRDGAAVDPDDGGGDEEANEHHTGADEERGRIAVGGGQLG